MDRADPDRYCVIGNPVGHSKSPRIHALFAAQTGQRLTYDTCLAPLDGFAATVAALRQAGIRGANVTVPFKIEAFAMCELLTERAQAAGAVNTLTFGDGGIAGDNTDGAGLVADIVDNAGVAIAGKRVLMVGAGGAARGAILPLLAAGPAALTIANRTDSTAAALAAHFGAAVTALPFDALAGPFDIIVNATAASIAGAVPPLPDSVFAPGTLALDMMYGAAPTAFMDHARARGAQVRDGLGMLVGQAAEAFYVWRGVRPHTAAILATLRESL